jgi:hypothetical protein
MTSDKNTLHEETLVHRVAARFFDRLGKGTPGGWARRKEKDDEVEKNINDWEPKWIPLWRKNKNRFKGTPDQRFEHFQEYTEEVGKDGEAVLIDDAEKKFKQLEREQRKHEKAEMLEAERLKAEHLKELERKLEDKKAQYGDRSPKQVYTEIAQKLKEMVG